MLLGWSPLQNSEDPSQPVAYLFDDVVFKKVGNVHVEERRAISPELLMGNIAVFSRAVQALRFKMKYRVATLSFHADDIDVTAFNSGDITLRLNIAAATELFLEMLFRAYRQSIDRLFSSAPTRIPDALKSTLPCRDTY